MPYLPQREFHANTRGATCAPEDGRPWLEHPGHRSPDLLLPGPPWTTDPSVLSYLPSSSLLNYHQLSPRPPRSRTLTTLRRRPHYSRRAPPRVQCTAHVYNNKLIFVLLLRSATRGSPSPSRRMRHSRKRPEHQPHRRLGSAGRRPLVPRGKSCPAKAAGLGT